MGYEQSNRVRAARVPRGLGLPARGDGNSSGRRSRRAPRPDIGGPGLPRPYHFPALIQPFQAVAAPFPGEQAFRQALPRRNAGDQNAAVQETDHWPLPIGLRHARRAPRPNPSAASGAARNGFHGTGHSAFSLRAEREQIKNTPTLVKMFLVFLSGRIDAAVVQRRMGVARRALDDFRQLGLAADLAIGRNMTDCMRRRREVARRPSPASQTRRARLSSVDK